VGYVDAEPVHPAVEPEPQDCLEFRPHLVVRPVQVGLLGGEQVQVPLARGAVRLGDPSPRQAAEVAPPVVGWFIATRPAAISEEVAGPLPAARRGRERGPEPRMLVRGVVGDEVDDDPQTQGMSVADKLIEVSERAEVRVDVAIVPDVIARVRLRRGVERVQPDRVDAQVAKVRQPGPDAGQVPDPIAVRVGEAADIDLVDHRVPPPRGARPGGRSYLLHVAPPASLDNVIRAP
jgi:hypothetical protein